MIITGKYPNLRLRRNRKQEWTRRLIQESSLSSNDLILPIFIIFSWYVCSKAEQDSDSGDHSAIVIDEVAGMLVTLAFVPHEIIFYLCAFLLFRLFDIWKPWPISWVDGNIKGGWGVLFDDLIAGLLAGGIIYAIFFLI